MRYVLLHSSVTHCFVLLLNIFVTQWYMCYKSVLQYRCYVAVQAQGDHAMQALNNNATRSRSIYLITQNILQADIGNYSPICNISNFFRNVKMSKSVNFKIFVLML